MKILIITNSLQPAAAEHIGINKSVRGGWFFSSAKQIAAIPGNKICIASIHEHGNKYIKFERDSILYYILPTKSRNNYDNNLEKYWEEINMEFKPDIVHIYGTEYPLSVSYVNACGNKGVIVSIQGMVSIYEPYYYGGLKTKDIIINLSLKEILLKATLFDIKKAFKKRSSYEIDLLKRVKYIEGRTSWDKENCWAINPNLKYFKCNRTLRDEFYKHKWNPDNMEKYSIFLSQGRTPLKGMHIVLQALYIVKQFYPNVKLYVTNNIDINIPIIKRLWKSKCYNNYIRTLLKKMNLVNNVIFTGYLDEKLMCQRYLQSNVFICPSSIENSPNSIGEAQILGVPCIGSYVGGTMDMIEDGKTGFLYRFEEINMLAYKICHIFQMQKDDILALSSRERECALIRHSKENNTKTMIQIYNDIYDKEYNRK